MVYIFALGLSLLLVTLKLFSNRISFLKSGHRTIATVIDVVEYRDSENTRMHKPIYQFTSHTNEQITFEGFGSSSKKAWRIGSAIAMVYRKENPNKRSLLTFWSAFGFHAILLMISLILMLIGGGYVWAQSFLKSIP